MTPLERQTELLARIRHIWESARTQASRSVNTAHVCANWLIGKQIVEAEQGGRSGLHTGRRCWCRCRSSFRPTTAMGSLSRR